MLSADDSSEEEEGADRFQKVGDDGMKKPISVDAHGFPYGRMKNHLEDDVKLFAKQLDVTASWEAQPPNDKARFFSRLYAGMAFIFLTFNLLSRHVFYNVILVIDTFFRTSCVTWIRFSERLRKQQVWLNESKVSCPEHTH